jgi:hypothetical protein
MSLKTVIGGRDQRQGEEPDSESDSENTGKGQIIDATPLLLSQPQQFNQKNQQILKRGSTFFIHRCG